MITNILKRAKPPQTKNITSNQQKALGDLRNYESITIVPADKGRAIVVLDRDTHQQKINNMLSDKNTYEKITDKRRNRTAKDLNILLSKIKMEPSPQNPEEKQILQKLYYKLHSIDANPATFYGTPKIHKPDMPLRPITSSTGSPTYELSKHLTTLLTPLLRNKYSVKNSIEFTTQIKHFTIEPDEIVVSFDVISLFTSIPVNMALKATQERLMADATVPERTNMSVDNILKLLEFTLKNSYFQVNGEHYKQVFGCAMGSSNDGKYSYGRHGG